MRRHCPSWLRPHRAQEILVPRRHRPRHAEHARPRPLEAPAPHFSVEGRTPYQGHALLPRDETVLPFGLRIDVSHAAGPYAQPVTTTFSVRSAAYMRLTARKTRKSRKRGGLEVDH